MSPKFHLAHGVTPPIVTNDSILQVSLQGMVDGFFVYKIPTEGSKTNPLRISLSKHNILVCSISYETNKEASVTVIHMRVLLKS
jgi:hypothetical protein